MSDRVKLSYFNCGVLASVMAAALFFAGALAAQQTQISSTTNTRTASPIPRLIKFNGTLLDEQGHALRGPLGVTFALYSQQSGGAALWVETQNVKPDASGNYTVLLGAASTNGIPEELFASGEARWLGVQLEGQAEHPRVLLVSVPYALEAGDAQTLGGRPASDFVLSRAPAASASSSSASAAVAGTTVVIATGQAQAPLATTIGGGGTANDIPIWTGSATLGNSVMSQAGGNVSVAGRLQLPAIGAANSTTKGFNSQPLDLLSSVFNGTAAVNQHFRWQAEPVKPGSAAASGKLNLLFASGTSTPAETGFSISNKGLITFAPGQTLPKVTGNEAVTGNLSATQLISTVATGTAPLSVKSTTQVPNLNASFLGGKASSAYALLGASNSFVGDQNVTGNVTATGLVKGIAANFKGGNATSLTVTQTGTGDGMDIFSSGEGIVVQTSGSAGIVTNGGILDSGFVSVNGPATGAMSVTTPGMSGTATTALTVSDTDKGSDTTLGVNASTTSTFGLGVKGTSGSSSKTGSGECCAGVWGDTSTVGGAGVLGTADEGFGVMAISNEGASGRPTMVAFNVSTDALAPVFSAMGGAKGSCSIEGNGNLDCTGAITSNGNKPFKIDDPTDPADKYLVHVAVESSEMINIYTGNVVLDGNGAATVQLPSWFQTENADFRYALTAIGAPAPSLYIAGEVANNQFKIAGGKPGQKVSWQITAPRQDAWAKANPLQPEIEKPENERGFYVHPELFGQPQEKSVYWKNRPQLPKGLERNRENQAEPQPLTERPAAETLRSPETK